ALDAGDDLHAAITDLFTTAFNTNADIYDNLKVKEDRIGHDRSLEFLIPAGACGRLVEQLEVTSLCMPSTAQYVIRALNLLRGRLDPSWPVLGEQPHEHFLIDLVVRIHRQVLPVLQAERMVTWEPLIADDVEGRKHARRTRRNRFAEEERLLNRRNVTTRRIYESATTDSGKPTPSRFYYQWEKGVLEDSSRYSLAIEAVLRRDLPLLPPKGKNS